MEEVITQTNNNENNDQILQDVYKRSVGGLLFIGAFRFGLVTRLLWNDVLHSIGSRDKHKVCQIIITTYGKKN